MVTEPISVLSRSFAPEAPAVCQFVPVAAMFQVTWLSLNAVFKRYTRMMRLLLERSAEVQSEKVADVIVALAGIDDKSNLMRLRATLLLALLSSPTPMSMAGPKLEVFERL